MGMLPQFLAKRIFAMLSRASRKTRRHFLTNRRGSRSFRPWIEHLEGRHLLATLTVTTVADDLTPNDGTVSLREALTALNAGNDLGDPDITAQNPGIFGANDRANFNIPGLLRTINVGTDPSASGLSLPSIVKPVTVD